MPPDDVAVINPTGDDLPSQGNKKDEIINGTSFTVLVAGYNIKGDSQDAMLIVDVDKEKQKVTTYSLNTNAKVYVGHGSDGSVNVRLGDLCKYKDMNYISEKVTALTAIKIDYYFTLTANGFIKIVDTLNKNKSYTYTVPFDMEHEYSNEESLSKYNINYKKNDKLSSGIDIYNVLRYTGDSGSQRMGRQASIAWSAMKGIISAQFKSKTSDAVISTIKALLVTAKECETNIHPESFFEENFDLIMHIPDFSYDNSSKFENSGINFK